jgi:hypothetical protein
VAPFSRACQLIIFQLPGPRGVPLGGKELKSTVTVVDEFELMEDPKAVSGMAADSTLSTVLCKYNCSVVGSAEMSNLSPA